MILTLRAVSLNDQPLTRPITARFDAAGGTIGRADHSTMALPDPERFISRKQAEIVFINGGFLIRNVGAANPINLGQQSLAVGESAMLVDGEDVRIGGYLLRAECSTETLRTAHDPETFGRSLRPSAPPLPAPPPARAVAASPQPLPVPAAQPPVAPVPRAPPAASGNPFADLLGDGDLGLSAPPIAPQQGNWSPGGGADPFADILGSAPAETLPALAASMPPPRAGSFDDLLPPAAGLTARSAAIAPPPPAGPVLPDDFDPFAAPSPTTPRPPAPADPFAALAPVAPPATLDQQFGLGASASSQSGAADPLVDFEFNLAAPPARASTSLPATDPLAMFESALEKLPSGRTAGPIAPSLPMQDNLPGVFAAFEAPGPARTSAPVTRAPRTLSGHGDAALWLAFCEGAGIQLALPSDPALAAERMRLVGQVLRAAVEGTRELMAVRASTKYELRAAVTQIQARSNNPLKFAPDLKTGLEQLVQPAVRGFLEGPAAMDDAMQDLVGHSIGSVAGMRAALEGLLDRFDPASLENTLGNGSVLDNLMPQNRRAKLWELYLQRFKALREEAQENFHALFGKAFVAAYEQQVARLKRGADGPGPARRGEP